MFIIYQSEFLCAGIYPGRTQVMHGKVWYQLHNHNHRAVLVLVHPTSNSKTVQTNTFLQLT